MQFNVQHFETLDSTNSAVKRAIEQGKPEGYAACALVQTQGYGRQGRMWQSPLGGMYMSFLLQPKNVNVQTLPTLSLAAGVAVRRAVANLVPAAAKSIQIKWPNDVVVVPHCQTQSASNLQFQKLAGISVELYRACVCLGVGINVFPHAENTGKPACEQQGCTQKTVQKLCRATNANKNPSVKTQHNVKNTPAYMCKLGFAHENVSDEHKAIGAVAHATAAEIASAYEKWCKCGFNVFEKEFNAHSALNGKYVHIQNVAYNTFAQGCVRGVEPDGQLLLETEDGQLHRISSGEAHIV